MMRNGDRAVDTNEVVLCDCAAECVGVRITKFTREHDEDDETYLTIYYQMDYKPHSGRLKALWALLRGKPFHVCEMVLGKDDCKQIARALVRGYDYELVSSTDRKGR
jgi:hypothetical protein